MLLAVAICLALVTGAVAAAITAGRRAREEEERDDLEAARLRLLAAGEDVDAVHDCNTHEPYAHTAWRTGTGGDNDGDGSGGNLPEGGSGGNVYTSRHAADTAPTAEPLDQRTAVLVVDPTLTAADVATIVEHVEPGTGSLASFAATACDTREMRTRAEEKHIAEVYEAAHDENTVRDLDTATGDLWGAHSDVWAVIDAWVERYHGKTHYATCVHCTQALHVQSDEYAQLVAAREGEHTGEISKADIDALYAAQAPALFRA